MLLPLFAHVRALEAVGGARLTPLVGLTGALLATTRALRATPRWDDDQGTRLAMAEIFTELEALVALVELADPDRRRALGMPTIASAGPGRPDVDAVARFALAWFGGALCGRLRQIRLAAAAGNTADAARELDVAESTFLDGYDRARTDLRRQL